MLFRSADARAAPGDGARRRAAASRARLGGEGAAGAGARVDADPGVVVERRRERADREAPGFLSSRVTWTFAYRITVKNVSAITGPASVEIVEPVPVSRDDRVKVEIQKANPPFLKGEKEDRERESQGFLRWRIPLKPGEERAIELVYTVSAPEDLPIAGLEK